MLQRLRSLFRVLASRHRFEDSMAEELRFHIEQYAADLMRSGVSPDEAYRRARMELGGLNTVKSDCRQARGLAFFDEAGRELGYAARLLRKSPGFAAAAVFTIALCLGANLTIFAIVDAILVRPLPFPQASRLVTIFNTYPKAGVERDGSSITNYYERRGRIPAFNSLSIYKPGTAIIGAPGSTMREQITLVSPDFFRTLGVGPAIGRVFTDAETTYQTDDVAILSDGYWRQYFNADRRAIGRTVWVDGYPKTIIGILPADFRFLSSHAQLYLPLSSRPEDRTPQNRHSGGNVIQMIARLAPGATIRQAQAQIDAQNAALEKDDPQAKMIADAGFRSLVVSLHADQVAAIRPILLLLQAAVLVLLLIGTVNLMNLLLVRANGRLKDLAIRQALGASRGFIVSEALVETTLLAVAGGLLGLAVAAAGIRLVAALGANRLPLGGYIAFNIPLAAVGVAAAIVLGVVLAAPIAIFNFRADPSHGLQSEARGGSVGHAAESLRHCFIVAQIALAFVLLEGAGLLGLSLERAMAVSPGFQPDHVVTAQISLVGNRYATLPAGLAFTERFLGELGKEPGVSSAGIASNIPFSGSNSMSAATVDGYVPKPGEPPRGNYSYGVTGDYFQAMGLPLEAGRFLTAEDSRRTERVCVVDENFARHFWPHTSPLGHRLFQGTQPGPASEAFAIVGIVGSIRQTGLTDDTAQGAVYYPFVDRADSNIYVVARGSLPADSLKRELRSAVRQIDPALAVNDLQTMDDRIADSLLARRSPALLAGLFSAMGLLLAAIGTYGVLSYAVAQRRREIGVRMALGARPRDIRQHFFLLALRLLAGGVSLGLLGAWLTGQAMQAVLFHVPAHSLAILAASTAVITAVSFCACLLPADRAARISPMHALMEQ